MDMIVYRFERTPQKSRWGECEEVLILAEHEDQAWGILTSSRLIHETKDFRLVSKSVAEVGEIFSTSYTLGV